MGAAMEDWAVSVLRARDDAREGRKDRNEAAANLLQSFTARKHYVYTIA